MEQARSRQQRRTCELYYEMCFLPLSTAPLTLCTYGRPYFYFKYTDFYLSTWPLLFQIHSATNLYCPSYIPKGFTVATVFIPTWTLGNSCPVIIHLSYDQIETDRDAMCPAPCQCWKIDSFVGWCIKLTFNYLVSYGANILQRYLKIQFWFHEVLWLDPCHYKIELGAYMIHEYICLNVKVTFCQLQHSVNVFTVARNTWYKYMLILKINIET